MTHETLPRDERLLPRDARLERLMTLPEVAEYVQLTVPTLYGLRHGGKGPIGSRLGKQLRFRRTDVDAWVAGLRDEPRVVA